MATLIGLLFTIMVFGLFGQVLRALLLLAHRTRIHLHRCTQNRLPHQEGRRRSLFSQWDMQAAERASAVNSSGRGDS